MLNPYCKGTRVQIVRTSNKHAQHHVGKDGVIIGDAPLGLVIVKLNDGTEYWAETLNLRILR